MSDRVQQVGLAETDAAPDEERVVLRAGLIGHGQRGGVGEAVRRADDIGVEDVARVETAVGSARVAARRLRRTGVAGTVGARFPGSSIVTTTSSGRPTRFERTPADVVGKPVAQGGGDLGIIRAEGSGVRPDIDQAGRTNPVIERRAGSEPCNSLNAACQS